jgi:serine/threonine-protein kinase
MTETGMSLGTPHYMSPEQATAEKDLTNRSDIYSLACVLYEMLTGEPPHTGGSAQAIIMKIVTDEARPVTELRKSVPLHVAAATAKALEKLAADRFESAANFGEALTNPAFTLPTTQATAIAARPAPRTAMRWLPWGVAVVAIAVALLGWFTRNEPSEQQIARFYAMAFSSETFVSGTGTSLALSPDGSQLVYRARSETGEVQLFLRRVDQLEGRPIAGTTSAIAPFFSPDGEWIGFHAEGRLRKVAATGGPPSTITQVPGDMRGASWGPDDFIVFAPASGVGLSRVAAAGGDPEILTEVAGESGDHRWPNVLPNGKGAVFTVFTDVAQSEIWVVSFETRETRRLVGGTPAVYMGGYLVFGRAEGTEGTVLAAPFDVGGLELTGPPVPLLEGVMIKGGGAGEYSVSPLGNLAYISGTSEGETLVLVDRSGLERPLDMVAADYHHPRFAPDGRSVAVSQGFGSIHDIWTYDIARGAFSRLTFDGVNWNALWTKDGSRIVYGGGTGTIGWSSRTADGSGTVEPIRPSATLDPVSWGPEGQSILASSQAGDIFVVPLAADDSVRTLLANSYAELWPSLSPDGTLLAYGSNETGQFEVYVQEFPGLGGRRQISTSGGREPLWSKDGTELFYRGPEGLVAVPIDRTARLVLGDPVLLFDDPYVTDTGHAYDIHPDGDQFVFVTTGASSQQMVVVLNWLEELKAKVGR